jgi:hypothetical protein
MTDPDRTDALAERLFTATLGALELFSVYLGAGYARVDVLAVDNDFFRLYRLHP